MNHEAKRRSNSVPWCVAALVVALAACTELSTRSPDARSLERATLEAAASQVAETAAFDPAGWEAIGPNVWRRVAFDDVGRQTGERIKAQGPGAFEWLRDVYFPEQIVLIEAELRGGAEGVDRLVLQDRLDTARRFVLRTGR